MSGYIFYTLGFIIFILALCSIVLPKISTAVIFCGIFFISVACLYFSMGSIFLGLFQLIILGAFVTALFLIGAKQNTEEKFSSPFVKKPRVFFGLIFSIILIILSGALIYYFKNSSEEIIFLDKGFVSSKLLSLYVIVKTIFSNYQLAYMLIILTLFAGLTGVGILIPKKKADNNDK